MTNDQCPDCLPADGNPHWGGYTAWCPECSMRALAHGYRHTGIDNLTAGQHRALNQELGRHYPRTPEQCRERIRFWIGRIKQTDFADTGDSW